MLQYVHMSEDKNKAENIALSLPRKPTPPEPYECCERGCDPCVHDYYAKALERWEKRVADMQKNPQK